MIIKYSSFNSVFMLLIAAGLLMQCNSKKTQETEQKTETKRPNIIVILSDDMGYSDIGCYGGEINTPNLDQLASNGLRFTQFYNTARCCPSRASLLTGLYPHQAGIGEMTNDRGIRGYEGDLSNKAMTMAEVMKTAGYSTYMSGKWHVTPYRPEGQKKHNWPMQRGFDQFYGTIHGAGSFYDPNSLSRGNEFISPYNDPEYTPETYYYTDAISDHATKYIKEHKGDNPFFMYVAYTAAHWPMHALKKDIDKYSGKYADGYAAIRKARLDKMIKLGMLQDDAEASPKDGQLWDDVENKEWEERCMEVYAAMVDNMDQGIGRIMAELERKGELDHTLILFMQDNGGCHENYWGMREGREPVYDTISLTDFQTKMLPNVTRDNKPVLMGSDVMPGGPDSYISYGLEWANVSNTPFRMYKTFVHEGGITTPLIVHWPKGIKAKNQWRTTPGHLIDIMATCVDVAGATYPTKYNGNTIVPLEGKSLMPVFDKDHLAERMLFFEHERNMAIRSGNWKLIRKNIDDPWELYNLENDRTEMNNLAESNPAKAKELEKAWEEWALRVYVKPFPESLN